MKNITKQDLLDNAVVLEDKAEALRLEAVALETKAESYRTAAAGMPVEDVKPRAQRGTAEATVKAFIEACGSDKPTRKQIQEATGLSQSSVHKIVANLTKDEKELVGV